MTFASKPPLGQKAAKAPRDFAYMGKVKRLPCAVCGHPPPSDAHHTICDRHGNERTPDRECIPLCKRHHQHGPEAIHAGKASWVARHGKDTDYIKRTRELVAAMDEDDMLGEWF